MEGAHHPVYEPHPPRRLRRQDRRPRRRLIPTGRETGAKRMRLSITDADGRAFAVCYSSILEGSIFIFVWVMRALPCRANFYVARLTPDSSPVNPEQLKAALHLHGFLPLAHFLIT